MYTVGALCIYIKCYNITCVFNFFFFVFLSVLLNGTLLILIKIAFGKTIASSMNLDKLNEKILIEHILMKNNLWYDMLKLLQK